MNELILRRATPFDMNEIAQLQFDVFKDEQNIPDTIIPLSEEKSPQWWCAL